MLLDAVVCYRGAWNGIEQCGLCQGASGVGSVGALGSTMVIGVAGRRTAGGCDGGWCKFIPVFGVRLVGWRISRLVVGGFLSCGTVCKFSPKLLLALPY